MAYEMKLKEHDKRDMKKKSKLPQIVKTMMSLQVMAMMMKMITWLSCANIQVNYEKEEKFQ